MCNIVSASVFPITDMINKDLNKEWVLTKKKDDYEKKADAKLLEKELYVY